MTDRIEQVRSLYGFSFPAELFEFWEWFEAQDAEEPRVFHDILGMTLCGPFDVLAGKFDGVVLRYSPLLHYRYSRDPAEFFTIASGNTDGLHWGYWFDHPGELPPNVASYWSRDAFEISTNGTTLVSSIKSRIRILLREMVEYMNDDSEHEEDYRADIASLESLESRLPPGKRIPRRLVSKNTPEGMGIVVSRKNKEKEGKVLLVKGKKLWFRGKPEAFDVLEKAYAELGRGELAAVVCAHREHPDLQSVDILSYS